MHPDAFKLYFRLGMFITLLAGLCVLTTERGSAEFVVSVLALVIGVLLLCLVGLATLWFKR